VAPKTERLPMLILLLSSMLAGAIFGMRLKVWLLLPALFLVFVLVIGKGTVPHDNPSAILLAIFISGVGTQIGYLAGVILRFTLTPTRTPSSSTGTLARGLSA
jgi:hypothetical protein